MLRQQPQPSLRQIDGEEEAAPGNEVATIVGHGHADMVTQGRGGHRGVYHGPAEPDPLASCDLASYDGFREELNPSYGLPDHLHTIWTLPEGDADFATPGSSRRFHATLRPASGFHRAMLPKANAVYGSGAIGSISFAMTTISPVMSTTFISTRSSTDLWRGSGIGRIRHSIAW
jgi:hypothetical protein